MEFPCVNKHSADHYYAVGLMTPQSDPNVLGREFSIPPFPISDCDVSVHFICEGSANPIKLFSKKINPHAGGRPDTQIAIEAITVDGTPPCGTHFCFILAIDRSVKPRST